MIKVKACVEYEINLNNNSYLLDSKKFQLLENIENTGSITKASKAIGISYRTALNYIDKIEENLDIKVVKTSKGGSGGGGGSILTKEGSFIIKECKKINIVMELNKKRNEIPTYVKSIDEDSGFMILPIDENEIKIPINNNLKINDKVLALIRYDNLFIMNEICHSSIRNIFKGTITELKLYRGMIRVKTKTGNTDWYCDITIPAQKELGLEIGKEVYLGFKATSVAVLKI